MRFVGKSVQRVEDFRILTGRGRYIDDVQLPGMLHAAFLRSPYPHALIVGVDTGDARGAPGVVGVYTGEDIKSLSTRFEGGMAMPGVQTPEFYGMATVKVRFVGDLVAMVVAESRALAEDAAELVVVDYEPLAPVVSYADALDPAGPLIFDDMDDNVMYHNVATYGDVEAAFAEADRVVSETFVQRRQSNCPIETRGAIASYDPGSGVLTYYTATRRPHGVRLLLSKLIGQPIDRLRVVSGDVGGAFGLKGFVCHEDVSLAAVGKQLGRPVKWIEDRNEHLLASGQARQETVEVEAAVKDDGTLLGIKAKLIMDQGAYPSFPFSASMFTGFIGMMLPGPYKLTGYSYDSTVVATNKCSYVSYRGPWEVETWVRERLLDVISREMGMDPIEIRRKNMVHGAPEDHLITGPTLSGVSSLQSFERALALADYGRLRAEQAEARASGRYLGIGFATFIESAPGPAGMRVGPFANERARVRLEADGHLTVSTAQAPHGQGHETTLAQIAADEMGIPFDHVRIVHGNTDLTPFSLIGTGGSRAASWGSGAVMYTTRKVKDKVLAIASDMLEISAADLEIADGAVRPKGVPLKSVPLATIAYQALMGGGPEGSDGLLEASEIYRGEGIGGSGWSGGTHLCVVEVDVTTGEVSILRWIAVEDCGRVINPAIVEGQVRGGVAQGIAGVLYEWAAYDEDGQPLATTFMDYLVPTATEIPEIEIDHLETEPEGDVDFRGAGEGGALVAPAALTNAIEDALAPLGVRINEQYLPPSRLLELAGIIE